MKLPYRTKQKLERVGTVCLIVLIIAVLAWVCWVVWLSRYVIYGRDGAVTIDFSLPEQSISDGVVAAPPEPDAGVSIYYNEGADAVELTGNLSQLNGYYISYDDLKDHLGDMQTYLNMIPAGTAVMIELKGGYGSFYYSSGLSESISSASVDVAAVDELIKTMKTKGFYLIARVSAFRDYNFGDNHVACDLTRTGTPYAWMDDGGCYWLKPNDTIVLGWISSIVTELKDMGFHEVLLSDFRFPNSDKYSFSDDKEEALSTAAQALMKACASDNFTLSFGVATSCFVPPEGRCRLYLEGVEAKDVQTRAGQATVEDPLAQLVFLGSTNDTRYDAYSVLRPISLAEVIEAQKADTSGNAPAPTAGEG